MTSKIVNCPVHTVRLFFATTFLHVYLVQYFNIITISFSDDINNYVLKKCYPLEAINILTNGNRAILLRHTC